MKNIARTAKIEAVEAVIRGLISKTSKISPEEFFVGLHNAFAHGDIMASADFSFEDSQLEAMFEHFDALSNIAKDIG